jgi:two-component system LytT family response regulator
MSKQTIILVDDEHANRQIIKEYLKENEAEYELIAECVNGVEAVKGINTLQPDIVFLDIKMPGKNGFQVLNELTYIPKVVFTTAYDDFAIKAFEVNAVDYLLKPFTKTRFEKTLERLSFSDNRKNLVAFNNSLQTTTQYLKRIFIESGQKLTNINISDIIYLKAEREYCKIYTSSGSKLCSFGIGYMESVLDPHTFIRIHRSYIVNIHYTNEIFKDIYKTFVRLNNNVELPVGRSFQSRLKRFIF